MSESKMRLIVSDEATLQITEQSAYYEKEATLALALRWEDAVESAIRSLRTLPERGAVVLKADGYPLNLRKLHIEGFPKHLLFYQFEPETEIIWIICVLHGARDIDLFLQLHARGWL